jgi:hypothetical protein
MLLYYFVVVIAATPVAQEVYNWSTANGTSAGGGWDIEIARYRSADGSSWTFEDRLSVFQLAIYATPVPEPETYALLGLGLASMSFLRLRQTK